MAPGQGIGGKAGGHTDWPVPHRLGFTYLRLKDSYMEILNRNGDIER